MENVLAPEVAEEEIKRIVQAFEVDPEGKEWEDSKARLKQAIMKGRITLDDDSMTITQKLATPIRLKNGDDVHELTYHEPTAGDLKVFDKYKDGEKMAKTIHLASKMTGQPIAILEDMGSRDMSTMGSIASLFF